MTMLKTKIGTVLRSRWAVVCYLLLLPIAAQVIGEALWNLIFEITYSLGLDMPYLPLQIILRVPLWLLGVTLILAVTLGNDIPKLLRDSKTWLSILIIALLSAVGQALLQWAAVAIPPSYMWEWAFHLIAPIRYIIELAAVLLLLVRLQFTLRWSRRAILWVSFCLVGFILESELATWMFNAADVGSGMLIAVMRRLQYSNVIFTIFGTQRAVATLGLCLSLTGGSLWQLVTPAIVAAPEAEPLEMSPEAVRGERALRYLFITWLALIASSLLMDGGFSISSILLLSCNAVFLYYGRRWARLFWFLHTATMVLGAVFAVSNFVETGVVLLNAPSLIHLTAFAYKLLPLAVAGVQLVVAIRLLLPRNTVASYMIYRMISPPDLQQLVWERRTKITCGCVVVVEAILIGVYLVFRSVR